MIDLEKLKASAEGEGENALVSRRLLKQCAEEIAQGRAAQAQIRAQTATMGVCAAIERRAAP